MVVNRIGKEEEAAVLEVMRRRPVTLSGFYKDTRGGPSVKAFESALRTRLGGGNVYTCSNGTDALQIALLAAGIGHGDKVAVPALSFSATASTVLMVGAEPVFIDVDADTYGMNAGLLEETAHSTPLKAAIPVHLLGVPVEINKIRQTCDAYDMILIEDNAQGIGARFKNANCGAWGHLSTMSFQETKVITTLGEGGAIAVNCGEEVDQKVLNLRNAGQQYADKNGHFAPYPCSNSRMTEAQAAMGLVQLGRMNRWICWQRENRLQLRCRLTEFGFQFQASPELSTHYILGSIHEDGEYRERVVKHLNENGWGQPIPGNTISLGYTKTLMDYPLFKQYRRNCPTADWLVKHFVWWDVHRWIDPAEFMRIADKIASDLKRVEIE